jgi:hypothetical protein
MKKRHCVMFIQTPLRAEMSCVGEFAPRNIGEPLQPSDTPNIQAEKTKYLILNQ